MPDVREISALDAHPLRRDVLRRGVGTPNVHYPQDDDVRSFHLGVFAEQVLVAVASFTPAPTPHRPGADAWQLRGMAVADAQQRRGVGAALIADAKTRVAAAGATVLWCNARDTALGFYERLGFTVYGDGFATADTGLPHHVMVCDL
ncbi:MAG TPA: GNAT family N-acetyltransferase [Acidimicrobiales bacterium]|nr:GNAT family N-acetyltransferase [Acidimicrobiales bacterium]